MLLLNRYRILSYEIGLLFREGEFRGLLSPGTHWIAGLPGRTQVEIVSKRTPWLVHEKLDLIVKSGALNGHAVVLDLKDHERALVWIDGRFSTVLASGMYVYWTGQKNVRCEIADASQVQFEHAELKVIAKSPLAQRVLDVCSIDRDHTGVLYIDGRFVQTLGPGLYAFWKGQSDARVISVDLRETMVDVAGQELMTADKVTLRLNAVVTYRIADSLKAVSRTEDVRQAIYREAQLALRGVIGTKELDLFLTERDSVSKEMEDLLGRRALELGVEVVSVGIRDVILPGEMKDLLNRVIEARKAAEANLISRREETAAMRSQANTAKLLADNPVLMKLRELEVLESIASAGKLNVILGDRGLAEKVVNLL
ncbi:MAG: slipin family protein [Planctomyces sp.]|nr:slipin family protein [Planctomyces sp.]